MALHVAVIILFTLVEFGLLTLLKLPGERQWQVGTVLLFFNLLIYYLVIYLLLYRSLPEKKLPSSRKAATKVSTMDPTLQIVDETMPYLRRGLNHETALKTAEIIKKISDVAAVAITDREKVLAYIGVGCDKHRPGDDILTEATKWVIREGKLKVVQTQRELNCPRLLQRTCDCPLASSVIVPLKCSNQVVGALKLYETQEGAIPSYTIKLAVGIAKLLSMQIELARLDHQTQLATEAQLNALRNQINPHFFFNVLNTIVMFSRVNPEESRRLLVKLADFLRQSLKNSGHFASFSEEFYNVRTYLYLEKARFQDKLRIVYDVDPRVLNVSIPVLMIQPLVENAVRHGIAPKMTPGTVRLIAYIDFLHLQTNIIVRDDGVGIPADQLNNILSPGYGTGNGVGLSNVYERLKRLYGDRFSLKIDSKPNRGTKIHIKIPLKMVESTGGIRREA